MIFSFDALVACFVVVSGFSLFLFSAAAFSGAGADGAEEFFLQEKAVFWIDSLVKNRFEENPLLGAVHFDAEKHRVLDNVLDLALLEKAGPECFGKACAKKLCLKTSTGVLEIFSLPLGEKCFGVERLAVLHGSMERVVVWGVVCS